MRRGGSMWCGTWGCSKERTVGFISREKELRHSGSLGLGEAILGRGAGGCKQVREAGAYVLVEGAVEEKVGNILNGGTLHCTSLHMPHMPHTALRYHCAAVHCLLDVALPLPWLPLCTPLPCTALPCTHSRR